VSTALAVAGGLFLLTYAPLAMLGLRRPLLGRLAIREALRHRGQSALLVGGLLVGSASMTAALVAADSVHDSALLDVERKWGRVDVTVTAPGGEFFPAASAVQLAADRRLGGSVAAVQPGIEVIGGTADLDRQLGKPDVLLVGFDPASQAAFGAYELGDGRRTTGQDLGSDGVLVSSRLAADLQARVGDRLRVALERDASPTSAEFTVRGIARPEGPGEYGLRPAVFLPLAAADRLTGGDQVNVLRVALSRRAAPTASLRAAVIRLDARPRLQVNEVRVAETRQVEEDTQSVVAQLVGVSALVVAAGSALIVNLVVALAEERRSRLGTLRALGLTRRGLVLLSVLEGGLYSVVAAAAGTAVGVAGGWLLATRIAQSSALGDPSVNHSAVLAVHPGTLAVSFVAGAVITLATIVLTALRTSRLTIAAAIRDLPDAQSERGRPRAWGAGLGALAVVGVGAVAAGEPIARLAGGAALIVAVAGAARGRLSDRVRATLAGALLAAWSASMVASSDPTKDLVTGVVLLILAVLVSIFGLCILAAANLVLVETGLGLLGGLSARLRANLRPPLAYLARRPLRTGLATGTFAVVLVIVTITAVFQAGYRPDYGRDSAGYDVLVTSTGTSALVLPAEIQRQVAAEAALTTRLYVGPFATTSYGPVGEASFVPLYQLSDEALARPPLHLAAREKRYASDADVWRALQADSRLVVTSYGSPGDSITLRGADGPVGFEVAGSQLGGVMDGVIGSQRALAPFAAASVGMTTLLRAAPGVAPEQLSLQIRHALFGQAVDAVTMSELLDAGYQQNLAWLAIYDLLMRMGLVVGVVSLGILGVRALLERRRAVGVLRAIGYRSRDAVAGLVAEAMVTATIGVVVGIGAGLCLGYVFVSAFGMGARFSVDATSLGTALGLVYAAALLVTAVPAWRMARLDPATSVRQAG